MIKLMIFNSLFIIETFIIDRKVIGNGFYEVPGYYQVFFRHYFIKYFIKYLTFTVVYAIINHMKVGQLVNHINTRLKQDNPDLSPQNNLKTSNVNGYKAQEFLQPPPLKAKGKAYFEYTDIHEELIYRAYSMILHGLRTNVAFKKAIDELHSLF